MIHNNLRKVAKKSCGVTGSTITGYVDISGHVQDSNDTATNDSYIKLFSGTSYQFTNKTYTQICSESGSSYYKGVPYAAIGNSIDNEPDYSLGEIITSGYNITTTNSNSANLIFVSTLVNTGSADISFNEIGLFLHLWGNWNGESSKKFELLLIKQQLDNSMTLGVGESIAIAFNLFGDLLLT